MKQTFKNISLIAVIMLLSLSACKANVSRNDDGSVTVETSVTQEQLQEVRFVLLLQLELRFQCHLQAQALLMLVMFTRLNYQTMLEVLLRL